MADKLNAAFADLNPDPNSPAHLQLPRAAAADGFDNALTLQGWRGHGSGTLTLEGAPETLAKIGFPPTPRPDSSTPSSYCKVVSGPQVSICNSADIPGPRQKASAAPTGSKSTSRKTPFGRYSGGPKESTRTHTTSACCGFSPPISAAGHLPASRASARSLSPSLCSGTRWAPIRWSHTAGSGFSRPGDTGCCSAAEIPEPTKANSSLIRSAQISHGTWPPPPRRFERKANGWVLDAGVRTVPDESLRMTLQQATLANVDDAAGRWQFEGGEVLRQGNRVADYAATKRVITGGTDAQNTATLTMIFSFPPAAPALPCRAAMISIPASRVAA